jgi:hypothetical protein
MSDAPLIRRWRQRPIPSSILIAGSGIARTRSRHVQVMLGLSEYARAVLYNGLGRYEAALAPAQNVGTREELFFSALVLPELVEAATRCDRAEVADAAIDRLSERTRAAGTEWALGIEARSRALLSQGEAAERLYQEALERLGRTRLALELARAHLLYGEWLRRDGRRVDGRDQLHRAEQMFTSMGAEVFAAPAGREFASHWRNGSKAYGREPRRAHRPGDADRAARPRRALER